MPEKIKVLIVDDHEIFRNGLKLVLSRFDNIEVAGEAGNGKEFLDVFDSVDFDVVLLDIKMPEMDGIEATRRATGRDPNIRIIVLSTFGEEDYLEKIIDAGASGFLLKNVEPLTLQLAIQSIHNGQNYYSPELLPYFTSKYLSKEESREPEVVFTRRENEILKLIAQGFTNQEIADRLYISNRTVDTHKSNLISKTGSKNSVNLLIYAIKNGLVEI